MGGVGRPGQYIEKLHKSGLLGECVRGLERECNILKDCLVVYWETWVGLVGEGYILKGYMVMYWEKVDEAL